MCIQLFLSANVIMRETRIKILFNVVLVLRPTDFRKKKMMQIPMKFKLFPQYRVIKIIFLPPNSKENSSVNHSLWEVAFGAADSGIYLARHRYLRRSRWRRKTLRNKVREIYLY